MPPPFLKLLGVALLRDKRRTEEALELAKPEESIRQDGWDVLPWDPPNRLQTEATGREKKGEKIPDLGTSRARQQQGLKYQKTNWRDLFWIPENAKGTAKRKLWVGKTPQKHQVCH